MNPTFIRATQAEDKETTLRSAVHALKSGRSSADVFQVDPKVFTKVPNAPFAYWVSDSIRDLFTALPPFESDGRTAKQGLATADDFRFVRAWWEVPIDTLNKHWFPFAKGGSYSPVYADLHLVVKWENGGREIRNNLNEQGGVRSNIWMLRDTAENYFFRPGLTWPRRTNGFSVRCVPSGGVFADKGPMAFFAEADELLHALVVFNSAAYRYLIGLQLARTELAQSYEVGLVNSSVMPFANSTAGEAKELATLYYLAMRGQTYADELSHHYVAPLLVQANGPTFEARIAEIQEGRIRHAKHIETLQARVDEYSFRAYGIQESDRKVIVGGLAAVTSAIEVGSTDMESDDDEAPEIPQTTPSSLTRELLSWGVGILFGRFALRAQNDIDIESGPFEALPSRSPASAKVSAKPVLVSDASSSLDMMTRIRPVLSEVFQVEVPRWESDLAKAIGFSSLEQYFERPRGFFEDHLVRYSKSKRKAPLYWPLSLPSDLYTVWLFAPMITSQTLFTVVLDHVNPKIEQTELKLAQVQARLDAGATPVLRDERRAVSDLLSELITFRDGLLRVTELPYKPDLNDGILITAAPLAEFFQHAKWKADLQACWKKLQDGDYDWAHLAYAIWPDRVTEKCRHDRSLAIAHNLEYLCEVPEVVPKAPRAKKSSKKETQP